MRNLRTLRPGLAAAVLASALTIVPMSAPVAGATSTGSGLPVYPTPATTPRYDIDGPSACVPNRPYDVDHPALDPCQSQRVFLPTPDGLVYVETHLPARRLGGPPVRSKLPTLLVMTPYSTFDVALRVQDYERRYVDYFVPRGYAVAIGHALGYGNSDGCATLGGPAEVQATAAAIDFLGRRAPWSGGNARVGMMGLSNDGTTAIGAASLGDFDLIAPLKAIVGLAAVTSGYEYLAWNGVPTGTAAATAAAYAGVSSLPGDDPRTDRSYDCADENESAGAQLDRDGAYTAYWRDREYRRGAPTVKAATLLFQGLQDTTVYPSLTVGWFDRLPARTPHKIVAGQWEHEWPNGDSMHDGDTLNPPDAIGMAHAWFDRYLFGLDTGVDEWPTAQIESSNGEWRAAPDWPATGEPSAELPLARSDSSSTTFEESGAAVEFTFPQPNGLHISGRPELDLWIDVTGGERGAARLGVTLDVIDAGGSPVAGAYTYGARAVAYRQPLVDGYFHQESADPVPPGEAFQLLVPLMPTDLVVPPGGSVRLRIGGTTMPPAPASVGSGAANTLTIHHDTVHRSALRFITPEAG